MQAILADRDREEAADSLRELERLAETAGAVVVGAITQRRHRATSAFLVGEGKLAEIQLACRQAGADLIIFDNDLSPVQVNNLDLALGIRVIDRTELIHQIFALHAHSSEAQIQVELAQLEYLISRIPVSEKQQRFHGGIGMRGPGESPLQLRNAPMRKRIRELKKKLERIRQHRERTRERRPWPSVCLVGYTNAGKSTLLNALAAADAYVDDRLFSTLDTKTCFVRLVGRSGVLLTDTVGFIRHLPHGLMATFRSTLDVAREANLLLVVADASHNRLFDQLAVVGETLRDIGASVVPQLLALNKCDLLSPAERHRLQAAYPHAVTISAARKEGLAELKEAIAARVRRVPPDGCAEPQPSHHRRVGVPPTFRPEECAMMPKSTQGL